MPVKVKQRKKVGGTNWLINTLKDKMYRLAFIFYKNKEYRPLEIENISFLVFGFIQKMLDPLPEPSFV